MPSIAQAHVGMTWLLVFADGWHVCYTESRRDDPITPRYAVSGFYNMKEEVGHVA